MLGKVSKVVYKKSKPKKSYGFISNSTGQEFWFSLDGVIGFDVGDIVSFKGEENEKGLIATNVSLFY